MMFLDAYGLTQTNEQYVETEALGHSFGEWKETKAPTAEEVGEQTRTCDRCGKTETKEIPKLEPATTDTDKATDTNKATDTDSDTDEPKTKGIYGDLDGDGDITANDALMILRASVERETLTPEQTALADVDGDGDITANDALAVLRYSVGMGDDNLVGKPVN